MKRRCPICKRKILKGEKVVLGLIHDKWKGKPVGNPYKAISHESCYIEAMKKQEKEKLQVKG